MHKNIMYLILSALLVHPHGASATCWSRLKSIFVRPTPAKPSNVIRRRNFASTNEVLKHYSEINPALRDRNFIDALEPGAAHALFMKLLGENGEFQDSIKHTVWESSIKGRPVDGRVIMVEKAILSNFNRAHPGQVIEGRSPAIEVLTVLAKDSEEFRQWFAERPLTSDWKEHEVEFAQKTIGDWESETNRRNTPKPAKLGEYLNPLYEQLYTYAQMQGAEYVSSADGGDWLKVGGSQQAPARVPRWDGNSAGFSARLKPRGLFSRKFSEIPSPRAPTSFTDPVLGETAPTVNASHGLAIVQQGKITQTFAAIHQTDTFTEARAFGYHVTQANRLQSILNRGWLLDQDPTSGESSRAPGLHLSTHLGVTFAIGGDAIVLRTPLNPETFHGVNSAYYGHVDTMSEIPANSVPRVMEFSPDRGVSWYPLNQEFLNHLKNGLLPSYRGRPNYEP